MTPKDLQDRTLKFSVATFQFLRPFFRDAETRHIAGQLLKSSVSVAANYRASCLARSPDEWVAKLGIVREESDESLFWLIFIRAAGIAPSRGTELHALAQEADELTRIFAASYQTSKRKQVQARKEKRRQGRSPAASSQQIDR